MAGVVEIRNRRGLALAGRSDPGRYAALLCALVVYKSSALAAAQKLKSLAEDLTFQVDKTSLKKKRIGAGISAGGGGVAGVAGIAGLFAASPLIPAVLLTGSVILAAGGVVSMLAGLEAERSKKRIVADVEDIFKDLELKVADVQNEIQNLVDTRDDNVRELDRLMEQLKEDMTALPLSDANLPRLTDLLNILEHLREAYSEVPEDWMDWAKNGLLNAWHMTAPLVPVGLSQMVAGHAEACTEGMEACKHAWLSACDKQKPQHFNCYGLGGKVVYVAGLGVNVASTVWSLMEVYTITARLEELKKAGSSGADRERGMAAHLQRKASDLEIRLKFLFGESQL